MRQKAVRFRNRGRPKAGPERQPIIPIRWCMRGLILEIRKLTCVSCCSNKYSAPMFRLHDVHYQRLFAQLTLNRSAGIDGGLKHCRAPRWLRSALHCRRLGPSLAHMNSPRNPAHYSMWSLFTCCLVPHGPTRLQSETHNGQ